MAKIGMDSMGTYGLNLKSKGGVWLLAILAAFIPLIYAVPLIGLGLEDINVVKHLNEGVFVIINVWKSAYVNGPLAPIPFDPLYVYPKAFYNLAGVFLYPYSYYHGEEDFQTVLITWRILNALIGALAVLMLFWLVRRAFRSTAVAFVAAALFALTPDFLRWTANVRPNPIEQALIFASLLICLHLYERFSYRLFLLATLTGALAFASKYGAGLLPIGVPLLSVFVICYRTQDADSLAGIVGQQLKTLRFIIPSMYGCLGLALFVYAWLFSHVRWNGIDLFLSVTRTAFPADLLAKVGRRLSEWETFVNWAAWGVLLGLVTGLAIAVFLHYWSKNLSVEMLASSRKRLALFLTGTFAIQSVGIYLAVFFIVCPAYAAHPAHFLSEFGFLVYYIGLGGSFDDAPLPGLLTILSVTAQEVPGWWFLVPLVIYAFAKEIVTWWSTKQLSSRGIVLIPYILVSLAIFFSMPIPQIRHILPVVGLAYGFVAYAVVQQTRDGSIHSVSNRLFSLTLVLLVLGYAGLSLSTAVDQWKEHKSSTQDTGLEAGMWIRSHVAPSTSILTDNWTFYTPPEFQNVSTTTFVERKAKSPSQKQVAVSDFVVSLDPDIVIVADLRDHPHKAVHLDEILVSDPRLQSRGYHVVRRFDSQKPFWRFGNVRVFAKADSRLARRGDAF